MQEWKSADPTRTLRRYTSHAEQEADTIRHWNQRSVEEKCERRPS